MPSWYKQSQTLWLLFWGQQRSQCFTYKPPARTKKLSQPHSEWWGTGHSPRFFVGCQILLINPSAQGKMPSRRRPALVAFPAQHASSEPERPARCLENTCTEFSLCSSPLPRLLFVLLQPKRHHPVVFFRKKSKQQGVGLHGHVDFKV